MREAKVFWFTGLSGAGKTTIADKTKSLLENAGFSVGIFDGDVVRNTLHKDLGFSEADITENNRLIAHLCKEKRNAYDVIFVPIISPYARCRAYARDLLRHSFFEIYFDADLSCVAQRDTKGLYARAKNNQINNLIGYSPSNPYEAPRHADYVVHSGADSIDNCVSEFSAFVLRTLK